MRGNSFGGSPIPVNYSMQKFYYVTRHYIMQQLVNNAYNMISALVFFAIPVVFHYVLYGFEDNFIKGLYSRVTVRSTHELYFTLAGYHKATILVHWPLKCYLV